jgi:hypothetical protein
MKKLLIIPAILATAFTVSTVVADQPIVSAPQEVETGVVEAKPEEEKDEVFFVGQKELKISDEYSIKFSNLIGYKTKEETKAGKNGILIGLTVNWVFDSGNGTCSNTINFVKDEFATQSWWFSRNLGCVERVTPSQLNSKDPFQGECKFEKLNNFISKFDVLSPSEKADYLISLKINVAAMMDDCDGSEYEHLEFALCILNYLTDKNEYTPADKSALFWVLNEMQQEFSREEEMAEASKEEEKYADLFMPIESNKIRSTLK